MRINKTGWISIAITAVTVGTQTYAYLYILPLSLGPRVILQPWLMQQNYMLYKNIADEHSPLMYFLLLAAQPLASNSLEAAKLTLVLLIGIISLLTFWAGWESGGWLSGTFSLLFFASWSPIFGYGKLWHETFLAPIYILLMILWRILMPSRTNNWLFFTTGLLLGVALLIKQHALLVILAIVLWHSLTSRCVRRPTKYLLWEIAFLFLGVSLPVNAFTIYYWLQMGSLKEFAFWVIAFNIINHYAQWASLWPSVDHIKLLAPAYLLLPPFIVNLLNHERQDIRRTHEELGLVLLVSSSLMIYPRFGFFHLQASLPILAWLSGTTLAKIFYEGSKSKSSLHLIRGLVCSFPLLWMFYAGIPPVYNALRSGQPRKIYEYSNLVPLANELRQHIGPADCIYVLPDDEATANLYYLTRCKPPELWAPTSYPWFMIDKIKPQIVSALEKAAPRWIVYFPGRWGIEQHGQELLNYVQENYHLEATLSWAEGEVWLLRRTTPSK